MRSIYEYEKLERVKPIVDHGIKALSPFISRHGALTLALSLLEGLGLPLLLSGLTLEIEKGLDSSICEHEEPICLLRFG